mgnify:CR=1 FL=1
MATRKRQRFVAALLGLGLIGGTPATLAAENVVFVTGAFRRSISVADMEYLAQTGQARGLLSDVLAIAKQQPQEMAKLLKMDFGPGVLMNVNFPDCRPGDVQGVEVTRQGKRDVNLLTVDERVDMRGNNYYWLGFKRERGNPPVGTDLWAAFNKRISVTPLHMNLTQLEAMDAVRAVLDAEIGRASCRERV